MRWSIITAISNSSAGRATVLTPFVGQYLILNDAVKRQLTALGTMTSGETIFGFDFGVIQSLHLTYFGLFFVGIGIIIHNISCPAEFKRFSNSTAFANDFMSDFTPAKLEEIRRKWASDKASLPMDDTYLSTADGTEKREDLAQRVKRYQDEIFDILRTAFEVGDKSRTFFLWTSSILVFCGLITAFMPSVITFGKIACQFFLVTDQ